MGGGSSHSTTNPTIPPELSGMYRTIGSAITSGIGGMPLSDYYQMDPRQYAGMTEAEQAALGLAPGMLDPSRAGTAAYNMASNLGNMNDWYGADLNGVGALSQFQLGSPLQIGGMGMPGQGGGGAPPPGMPGQQPGGGGGGGPVGGGGFGFAGSAYQGGQAPPQAPQLVQQRRLPTPFQGATPAASSSS